MLLRVASPAFDHLPRIPTTASMVLENADWAGEDLQLRTRADSRYHLELCIPEMEQVAWKVLRASTTKAELSDKGQLAHSVEAISGPAAVLDPNMFKLVKELTTPRSKELMKELTQLRRDGYGVMATTVLTLPSWRRPGVAEHSAATDRLATSEVMWGKRPTGPQNCLLQRAGLNAASRFVATSAQSGASCPSRKLQAHRPVQHAPRFRNSCVRRVSPSITGSTAS